jgi:hypothetical protein
VKRILHDWLLILAGAIALLASMRVAGAAEADDRLAKVTQLMQARTKTELGRQALAHTYADRTAAIAKLKSQPSSWSRDRKLQELLRESQDMATTLDKEDAGVRALDAQIADEEKAAIASIDTELAAQPDATRADLLGKARAGLVADLSGPDHAIVIPDENIDPLDDPEDLDFKAQSLVEIEKRLDAEDTRLAARAAYYQKQVKLADARNRAEDDVFHDDQPRRKTQATADHTGGAQNPAFNDATDGPGTGSLTGVPSVSGKEDSADPSLVLANVVDPSTLDDLRRAQASSDPAARAEAAERARAALEARLARVHQHRVEMEERAKALRQ